MSTVDDEDKRSIATTPCASGIKANGNISWEEQKNILIVDDEADIRSVLSRGVENAGYTCFGVASGREALQVLESVCVDVVISDISMPQMSGLELIQQIKAHYDSDVMVMTGHTEEFTYASIIGLGAADFIQKPVSIMEFIARLKRVLQERSIRIERNQAEAALTANLEKFQRAMEGIIQAIATTVEIRDPYTAGHQERVAWLACAIAESMNLPGDVVYGLRMAAVLHDLGKIAIPAAILMRPGKLTAPEYAIIKNHVQYGYDILKKIEFPWPLAQIVHQHHERLDGSGYPRGLKSDQIVLEARILAVADVVETISSHRPYRPSLGIHQARDELIENRGRLYDAAVVDACVGLIADEKFKIKKLL